MRLAVDTERCVGAGMCALTAPELFDQDDDGTVVVLVGGPVATQWQSLAVQAAERCPSGAIRLVDAGV
jgi:ferredoxin